MIEITEVARNDQGIPVEISAVVDSYLSISCVYIKDKAGEKRVKIIKRMTYDNELHDYGKLWVSDKDYNALVCQCCAIFNSKPKQKSKGGQLEIPGISDRN